MVKDDANQLLGTFQLLKFQLKIQIKTDQSFWRKVKTPKWLFPKFKIAKTR